MLRKALVASFIKPPSGKDKAPEMKSTENRRLSAVYEVDKKMEGVNLEEKCLLLKSADKEEEQTKTDKDRQRQTKTDKDRQRQTKTDKDRQRKTKKDKERQGKTRKDKERQRKTMKDEE